MQQARSDRERRATTEKNNSARYACWKIIRPVVAVLPDVVAQKPESAMIRSRTDTKYIHNILILLVSPESSGVRRSVQYRMLRRWHVSEWKYLLLGTVQQPKGVPKACWSIRLLNPAHTREYRSFVRCCYKVSDPCASSKHTGSQNDFTNLSQLCAPPPHTRGRSPPRRPHR